MIWPRPKKKTKLDLWFEWLQENPALAYMKSKFDLDILKDGNEKGITK
jgi:hypothetical protein